MWEKKCGILWQAPNLEAYFISLPSLWISSYQAHAGTTLKHCPFRAPIHNWVYGNFFVLKLIAYAIREMHRRTGDGMAILETVVYISKIPHA